MPPPPPFAPALRLPVAVGAGALAAPPLLGPSGRLAACRQRPALPQTPPSRPPSPQEPVRNPRAGLLPAPSGAMAALFPGAQLPCLAECQIVISGQICGGIWGGGGAANCIAAPGGVQLLQAPAFEAAGGGGIVVDGVRAGAGGGSGRVVQLRARPAGGAAGAARREEGLEEEGLDGPEPAGGGGEAGGAEAGPEGDAKAGLGGGGGGEDDAAPAADETRWLYLVRGAGAAGL